MQANPSNKYFITNKISNDAAEILLYGYIDPYDVSAADFVKELRSLEKEYKTIHVRINSGGGSVFEGLTIYNAMKQSKAAIETFIDGVAASMASVIAMAGSKVHMSKVARLMIHQASTGSYGNSNDLKKNAEMLDGIDATLCAIYSEKCGADAADFKTKYFDGKDHWLTADEAVTEKFVDSIYDGGSVKAPEKTANEKAMWENYNLSFAAILNPQNNNSDMKQITLSAAVVTALKLDDNYDAAKVEAAVNELTAKVQVAEAAKIKAENDFAAYKKTETKKAVDAMVDEDVTATKLTAEQGAQLKEIFADNQDGYVKYRAALKAYAPVASGPVTAEYPDEMKDLMALSVDELFKGEGAERLKVLNLAAFKAKYRQYTGEEYKEPVAQ